MYGRDEYHETQAAQIEGEIKRLLDGAEDETIEILKRKHALLSVSPAAYLRNVLPSMVAPVNVFENGACEKQQGFISSMLGGSLRGAR